jgi:uncharacterized protein YcfJ
MRFDPATRNLQRLALSLAVFCAAVAVSPAEAQYDPRNDRYFTPSHRYCQDYARDYVRRYGDRGGGVDGAVHGAVRGAILGGVIDGKDGARKGARTAGAIGAIRGSREQRQDNDWLYRRAYDGCMRREWYD